ncbi:isochorismate synthase [Bacillus carboniphilus]|uniref:isochorismate synthase n=1 Tax=Bacillus carboniphilus TaxID=86663 RepID=A0ABN0W5S3_9BACI
MAVAQPTIFTAKAHDAIQMAKQKNEPFFVSEIIKLHDLVDPKSFYRAGQVAFQGERFYWNNADKTIHLVGLGNIFSIQSDEGHGRFADVEKEWTKFKGRVIANREESIEGTGPVLFGGFSFDPRKREEGIWSSFPNALFFVPQFLLTIDDNHDAYVSVTFMCTPDDDISIATKISNQLDKVLENAKVSMSIQMPSLVSNTEVAPIEWKDSVAEAIKRMQNKELEKVVLARTLQLDYKKPVDDSMVITSLEQEQTDSYIFSFNWGESSFVGATPERLVLKTNGQARSTCLAGSIGIGENEEETNTLAHWLLHDEKNTEEHQYVVQHISNTFEKLCAKVEVDEKPRVLKMRHIQHLFTGVKGEALHHVSLLDFVESLHPTPALGGTPRNKALQLIRDLEPLDRGFYAAPLGWCDFEDNGEFVVGLRSGLIQGNIVTLFAGCGVVASSDPEKEFEETSIKFKPMLTALGGMEN